ncbi:AGAP004286-PA-like protein [Anopheles sinensis]|uniref:AGAP004286-PA-like protein n=1 Tax=Anopheles sinensis TaxID=74873 RepID=A0A084VKB4_ANOSI|nr:AGAP004286-PA-like protein [Anopheles sinensis]
MAVVKDSATFFQHGNSAQFEYVLGLYKQALKLKAETRGNDKKAEKLMRLEEWYQNELPKLIKKRGRDAHLLHEELVQTMEWKQTRGKFYPQLSYLIKINTPRAVVMETKKAFRKLPNLEQALNALSNLKGVGITMASALLAAAAPESAPFMADECLMAIPDIEGIDYTAKEYLKFVKHIQQTMERLNLEVESNGAAADLATEDSSASAPDDDADAAAADSNSNGAADTTTAPAATEETPAEATTTTTSTTGSKASKGAEAAANGTSEPKAKKWSAHSVELALWTYYVLFDQRPELLGGMPGTNNGTAATQNGVGDEEEEDDDEEDKSGEEEENENGTVEDEGDNDENSRNAVMESSESESNEAGGGGGVVVANGKPAPLVQAGEGEASAKDATDSSSSSSNSAEAVKPEATKPAEQTNNGTGVDNASEIPPVSSAAAEDATVKSSGESLDPKAAPVATSLCATNTPTPDSSNNSELTDSDTQLNSVSSNGNNKRPLCCDDNADDKPELNAPKLIKL